MATKQKTAAARRQEAEDRLATKKAEAEATVMESALRMLEAPQPVRVPWQEYPAFDEFHQWPTGFDRPYYWSDLDDRTEDRYRPLYETAQDLKVIRAMGRRFVSMFPVAAAALESLNNYVIGPAGLTITAQAKALGGEAIAAMVQGVLDRFLDRNDVVGSLDREIHSRTREDGEAVCALYPDGQDARLEIIEPDYLVAPLHPEPLERYLGTSHKLNHWYHGVHTLHCLRLKRDDCARPQGYHVVFDRHGEQWDYLPAARVQHIKRNVYRTGRRGITDFYTIHHDLEHEAKLRRNTAVGAAILAAIVMIRQHAEGATKSSIESMVSGNSTSNYQKTIQDGTRTTYREHAQPGTVKDIPHGMTAMLGPLGTLKSSVYIEVSQFLLRTIWSRWNAPEYMSGDASNANYASTLVAESPFVKAREADQGFYGRHFEELLWKALRMYYELRAFGQGMSWQQIRQAVTLKIDMTEVASRDPLQKAQENDLLHRNKIKSKRTWAAELGLDIDEELQEMSKEPSEPAPQPSPFGGFPPFAQRESTPRLEALAERALKKLME